MGELDWDEQGKAAHAGLEPLRFLIGEWVGRGESHGDAVNGVLSVQPLLDGSWLQAAERMNDSDGNQVHSDLAFYRFDAEADALEVLQLFDHGHRMNTPVEMTDNGFRWVTGPGGPKLVFAFDSGALTYTVILPGEQAPAVQMTYKRA